MYSEKTLQVIESIKNMPDKEADILDVFVAGFRAGKQSMKTELASERLNKNSKQTD